MAKLIRSGSRRNPLRLIDSFATRETAQDVAFNYPRARVVRRGGKWAVFIPNPKRKNLFGFGKSVTHSTKLSQAAYEAGRKSGDTGQFRSWFQTQQDKSDGKLSSSLRRHAEQRYKAGVHSLWTEEKKETAAKAKEDSKQTLNDVAEALLNQGFKKSQAMTAAKRAYKPGMGFEETFKSAVGRGKTSKMSGNRKLRHIKCGSKTTRLQYKHRNPKADALEKRIDLLLNRVRSGERLDAMQREMLRDKRSPKYRQISRQYMKDVRELERLQKQYRELHGIENPAKFDRCVADVKKSLKKYKRPGNAYAICSASGTRNPEDIVSYTEKGIRILIQPSERRKGKWDLFVNGVHRVTKPTKGGAEGYARTIVKANPKHSARARRKLSVRYRTSKKAPKTKQSRNAKIVWSARQGKIHAQVIRSLTGYKVKLLGGKRLYEEIPAKHFDEAVSIARLRLADTSAQNPNDQDLVQQAIPGLTQADALGKIGHRIYRGVSKAARKTSRGLLKRFRGRRAKNPIDKAQKMYEEFHGEPSKEVLEIVSEDHRHEVVAAIGQLVSLEVELASGKAKALTAPGFSEHGSNGRRYWEFDERTPLIKRVLVTTSEDGKQLFLDGGDQSISNDELHKLGFGDRDIHDHMVLGQIKMLTYRTRKSFEAKGKENVDFWHDFGKEGSKGVLPTLLYYPRSKKLKIAGGRYYIAPPDRSLGNVSPGIVG